LGDLGNSLSIRNQVGMVTTCSLLIFFLTQSGWLNKNRNFIKVRGIPKSFRIMKTYTAKPTEAGRKWYLVDASECILGRLASFVATRLRGKHKPIYTPHVDTGDHIIVINANKVALTGKKWNEKLYYRHSGYVGGLKSMTAKQLLQKRPEDLVIRAVRGMLPKNRLGRKMLKKLKVYAGPEHPHVAQQPERLQL